MSEHVKDRTIRVQDIPSDAEVIVEQGTKPYPSFVAMFLFCGFLIYLRQTRFFGILFALALAALFYTTKNGRLLTITDRFLVSHDRRDQEKARIFYYDEIAKWEMKKASGLAGDMFILYMTDGSLEGVEVLYLGQASNALRKLMPDKEDRPDLRIIEARKKLMKKGK